MAGSFDSGCARRWRRYDGVNKTQPQQEHKAMTLRPFIVLTTYLGIACIFGFLVCQAWRSMGHRTGPLDHNGADSEIETLNAGDLFGDCKGPDEAGPAAPDRKSTRSELQSLRHLVCRLLLEKTK